MKHTFNIWIDTQVSEKEDEAFFHFYEKKRFY